ncbi:unnamed protein product [Didymodactylos carnosus]|uniref:Tc1-like transposase DDE domain-containing protein n=1 Tax=Didymodactylos carnosus TaxID=1234261 RepID=A0A816B8I3_9BILA|nr:unnamed protein product [Didymodactylos carnosus]CAF1606006.1 unnamed protein product [Didymodactylos carnosus]CAF4256341.1 unnamed protein product [Didymodactylos carnosus]CAF4485956.1 unnamed protein product [Didymodactylos carnosus]
MVWLGACSEGLTALAVLDEGTVNHHTDIKKVLPIARKCGKQMLGDHWTFQQDGATPHKDHHSQEWRQENFPSFIPTDRWPPNSPDLNPLDYSIWNELVQTMNWGHVTTKASLIEELKRATKKIPKETVLRSCDDFYRHLYQVLKNKEDYIR